MHEEHRANQENTRSKTKKKQKRKPIHKLITKRKRANERRERITSRESPSPRPIKKSSTKRSKHLITGTIQILKSPPIPFFPNTSKNAQRNYIPYLRRVLPQPIPPAKKQIWDRSRYNPRQAKSYKDKAP